jgi:NADP-dependent 3-hydroxy acid dehydrogenase YdfG
MARLPHNSGLLAAPSTVFRTTERDMNVDKCIFITGAASGIGLETARLFAKNGWFVGIVDVNAAGLESVRSEFAENRSFLQVMDVCDVESVKTCVKAFADKTGGRMDVLFNNAGILQFGQFERVPLEKSLRIIDVNLKGILCCIHCSLDYLKNTPEARVITMTSNSAIYGVPDLSVYSATKSAVCAVTEALDIELEKYGIIVSDILAPYVNTPMVKEAENKAFSVEKSGIRIEPSDVANTVWRAVHGKKLHWKMGATTYMMLGLFWVLPFIRRYVIKRLAVGPDGT